MTGEQSLALALCWGLLGGCAGGETRPVGPPPEYEPPRILPWDAGSGEEPESPFESAAVGGWLEDKDGATGDAALGETGTLTDTDGGARDGSSEEAGSRTPLPNGLW